MVALRHPGRLRVIYRQAVMGYKDSEVVAEAALEAWAQGHFFDLLELAVAAGTPLRGRDLEAVAARAGIDLDELHRALAERRHAETIGRDAALRERFGGGASLVWNGEPQALELSVDGFERAYDRAEARARERLAEGVPAPRLYATLVREAGRTRMRTESRPAAVAPSAPRARVRIAGAPVRGDAAADVTVVVFSDFECPFCRRQAEALAKLVAASPGRVRVVFKHFPLAIHPSARPAADAAACANLQGRFWELHDLFFALGSLGTLGSHVYVAEIERAAATAGLDLARFRADLASGRCAAAVDADVAEGKALGVDATPTVFVNGLKLAGTRGLADLHEVVEAELAPGLLEELTGP
jgi:protein-disulfide isomerase